MFGKALQSRAFRPGSDPPTRLDSGLGSGWNLLKQESSGEAMLSVIWMHTLSSSSSVFHLNAGGVLFGWYLGCFLTKVPASDEQPESRSTDVALGDGATFFLFIIFKNELLLH